MKIHLDAAASFLDSFIQPLSRVADSGILKIDSQKITSLLSTGDGSIIVYGEYRGSFPDVSNTTQLNIPDIKKLHKLLSLVGDNVDLEIDVNSISHTSDLIRFKYHLHENGVLKEPALNMTKLAAIVFDGEFNITGGSLSNLLKGSSLNPEIKKIYLTFKDGNVYAEITDKTRDNVDSFTTIISQDYKGTPIISTIPIDFEIIRLLSGSKISSFQAKWSTKHSIFNFELISDKTSLNYIVSALVK